MREQKMRLTAMMVAIGLTIGVGVSSTVFAARSDSDADLRARFDAQIHPDELRDWLTLLAAEPNHVGSPHDKANAEWILAHFKEWGWDARIETFDVLYPTPIHETLELVSPRRFEATLQEPPIPGDSSATAHDPALPAYVAYQGDGDVTAKLAYVNYGMPDDYKMLERLGVSVKGAIVIARYGKGWRGLKPRLAQEHGAVGCVIYSDPADDGYAQDQTYPDGPMRPARGIQRGSVADMTLYPGDPLTPGVGATKDAKRLPIPAAPTILKIPVLPVSYADAQVFLSALGGDVVPEEWRGALPITYHVGPGPAVAHLAVKSDWAMKPIYDVIATLKGSDYPDEWIVRGNHHDGWVFGGTDPLSGQIALLAEAKAMGALAKEGWRPKRTIIYGSWDAEEPMLLGSTEWAETHAAELKQHAILYVNTDSNHRGILQAGGSQDLQHFVNQIADEIIDPETQAAIGSRTRAKLRVDALVPHATDEAKENAKLAADPKKDFPIEAIGSGSDYSSFLDHLGIASLNLEFADEGESSGVYHSRYDTFEHHSRFVDPGFVYDSLLAKTVGWLVLRAADSDAPVVQANDFAEAMARDVADVKKLADKKRKEAKEQIAMLNDRSFALAADPTKSHGDPTAPKPVPAIDFAPLDKAVARLKTSAARYDATFAARFAQASPAKRAAVRELVDDIDQTLTSDTGLPGRNWYRNIIWAPGRNTGYGVKTLPGVREGIEDERFDDAIRYLRLTADVLNAYSARLDAATRVLNGR
jgi:N-acetylated-alpha-linked acidic dipeptidase